MDVVLINPEIPQNTGSIARTCAATFTPLHLVGVLGFDVSDKAVRRAGLDYWPHVQLAQHADFPSYLSVRRPHRVWLFSKFGKRSYYEADFANEDALVFGCETKGLGQALLSAYPLEQVLRIPILCDAVRSLNLSNAVSIVLYEALRKTGKI
jgi:tRNA (cytidine/uridine-2'-O-)-methyltransferase